MGNEEFTRKAVEAVVNDYNYREGGTVSISSADVYVVWSCKTLQNNKALLATNVPGDGIYYEATYNGDKKEMYVDRYAKQRNFCVKED